MSNIKAVNLNILIVSAVVICFEIISTRISSVIFVQNYAFIILSLAILGLGSGGIFSFYKINSADSSKILFKYIFLTGAALLLFIISVVTLEITNQFIYFILLFLPFFFAGIVYAQLFKTFAEYSFKIYAFDLLGAAIGSSASLIVFYFFNAQNAVLFLALILFASSLSFSENITKTKIAGGYVFLVLVMSALTIFGKHDLFGEVPIGEFPEKDFYFVYENVNTQSKIIDSRWSIYGRSDLVEYSHQDIVKQLFIDGSAGTQMYKFNGSIENHDKQLNKILLYHSTSIPFLFLKPEEKNNMLVIGPGGGKEVLTGLLGGVERITGVEVNPDFVEIVKKYKNYNGGIYTDFPNVNIQIAEGRHYIKKSKQNYDIILMALASTEQLQNIDGLAANENYLLTVEAIKDYLKILSPEGRLIFTVHNRWELVRIIVSTLYAFEDIGIDNTEAINHFLILGADYSPTVVIKKTSFSDIEIGSVMDYVKSLPKDFPRVTFMPYSWNIIDNSVENILLKTINEKRISLEEYIANDKYDISPVRDDSPFFYKINRGVPSDYLKLLIAVLLFGAVVTLIPYFKIKSVSKKNRNESKAIVLPLLIIISIGIGFMILEISLFQKFILYLGSSTISLSILLGSLLVGMGVGSYFGSKIYSNNHIKRLRIISLLIFGTGVLAFILYPIILNWLLAYSQVLRSVVSFILLLPLGFLLGIPFPTCLQILKQNNLEKYIPWMYGINGIMSVAGSISAITLSMIFGFTPAFFVGLCFYLAVFVIAYNR